MIDRMLRIVAPHHCYGCHKTGYILCINCKYDIIDERSEACLVCAKPSAAGICNVCKTTYQKAWCVGDRTDALERVINAMKFDRVKAAAAVLASLLDDSLPVLPPNTVVVPVPTVRRHIRQRGYDHTLLIAKEFAKLRQLKVKTVLTRADSNTQRGNNKKQRFEQAQTAFICRQALEDVPYLLIDDVVTTNATVRYGAKALANSGAKDVWVGVVARQELKKDK